MVASIPSRLPICVAPMAGGPSTADLVVAAGEAGALGFVAAGYVTAEALDERLTEVEDRTDAPYGVNLFLPSPRDRDPEGVRRYAAAIAPEAERLDAALGEPRWEDDELEAKAAVLAAHRPAVVSTTFAAPDAELVRRLRAGAGEPTVMATVASVADAVEAERRGVDLLCVQGGEAGGHRGVFSDDPETGDGGEALVLERLLRAVRARVDLPLVATGGVTTGAGIRAQLDAGAVGVQLGTAFLCCPEAGTSDVHRRALLDRELPGTVVTRAFTGRPARALANRFAVAHLGDAPAAYPEVHHLTRPLRAAAARAGDVDLVHLWAGTGWRSVTEEPAAELVRRLAAEAGLR